MFANLGMFVRAAAQFAPEDTALSEGKRSISYRELDEMSGSVALNLRSSGIKPGDRVALSLPNCIEFVVAYFGIAKVGGIVVPFNVMLTKSEISHILSDCGARAIIFEDDESGRRSHNVLNAAKSTNCDLFWDIGATPTRPAAAFDCLLQDDGNTPLMHLPATGPADPAVILYTSGTTGAPKGAILTHGNLCFSGLINGEGFGFRSTDRVMVTLPLFHVFGQSVFMLGGIARLSQLNLVRRFEAGAVLDMMHSTKTTVFGGVPTMYSALLAESGQISETIRAMIAENLRLCISGAASMPEEVLSRFESLFSTAIYEGYGLTEASPTIAFARRGIPRKIGSVGRPVWGVEVRIVKDDGQEALVGERGEILCRSPGVFAGYWNRDAATAETFRDDWLCTGDAGYIDPDGDIFIVDRIKDIIIRGGYNVYPNEVEDVLMRHPAVQLCAVVGKPDSHYGEEVVAHVVLGTGIQIEPHELILWARENMAGYKYPRQIHFHDELPMTGSGKVLKRLLRLPAKGED
jgi:long-chain acyl-CoA synthetase